MPAFMMNGVAAVNPSVGKQVLMSPFSGPTNSPFDAAKFNPTTFARENDPDNFSTGALSTGIGFGLNMGDGFVDAQPGRAVIPQDFTDDYTPGVTLPSGVTATVSTLMAIGGGKSTATDIATTPDGSAPTVPYTAGFALCGFGGGGSRDATAGPIFQGFGMKMVTSIAPVAVGAAVEAGFLNRESFALATARSVFGSSTAASGIIA